MRKRYWVSLLIVMVAGFVVSNTTTTNLCSIQGSERLLDLVEDSNLLPITNPSQLRELLSAAEYRQALDTTQYYDRQQKRTWTWRARDYVIYDDSLIVTKCFSAKLMLMYDNALRDTANGDREYFFSNQNVHQRQKANRPSHVCYVVECQERVLRWRSDRRLFPDSLMRQ